MKKSILSLFVFTIVVFFACDKDLNDTTGFGPISVVYKCPDDHPDRDSSLSSIPIIKDKRASQPRSCRFVYKLPPVKNTLWIEGGGGIGSELINNCAFKFYEDCDTFNADTLFMKNIGPSVGPDEVPYIGGAIHTIISKGSDYLHYLPGISLPIYGVATTSPDSAVYVMTSRYCGIYYPDVFVEAIDFAITDDYIVLVE
jgi:hypothetical protein